MNIIELFSQLETPDNNKLLNAITIPGFSFAKIAVNYNTNPVLLIASQPFGNGFKLKNIKLQYIELSHEIECKVSENHSISYANYSLIVFKSDNLFLQNYFLNIAASFIRLFSDTPSKEQIHTAFKNLIEIFRALTNVPSKTVQGIWAELFLIANTKSPDLLIEYWHHLPEERFDFNAHDEKIEVKSSAMLERIHTFSSEQLNPTEGQVLIASIFTKQISNGKSIVDLIETIRSRISNVELEEKLYSIVSKTLGNTIEQSIRVKFDYDLAQNSIRYYRHQDISKIEIIHIPERVSEVRYKSNLGDLMPVDLNNYKNGLLFKTL